MCLAAMVHPCDVCFVSSKQVGSRPLTRLQLCGSLLRLSFQALLKYKTYIPRIQVKGQLISKRFFEVVDFLQKRNENKSHTKVPIL